MTDTLALRGTLKGHSGWVTAIGMWVGKKNGNCIIKRGRRDKRKGNENGE